MHQSESGLGRPDFLALLGIAVGVPGLITAAAPTDWPFRALAAVWFGSIVAGGVYLTVALNREKFTHLRVESKLSFADATAHRAFMESIRTIRCNYRDEREYCWSNISSDGTINDFVIDGEAPSRRRTVAGLLQVCKEFGEPLKRGQQVQTKLRYTLIDAFPASTEFLIHNVEYSTKELVMVVELPPTRPCVEASCSLMAGMRRIASLSPPTVSGDGLRVEVVIRNPKVGSRYQLTWRWGPKPPNPSASDAVSS